MKYIAKLLFAPLVLIVPALLFAQSGPELHAEASQIHAAADKKLNAAYGQLIKRIRADNDKDRADFIVERLRESERAWLTYRDAQVAFVGSHANIGSSSARAVGMATYSAELTEERIKDFNDVPDPF